MVPTSIQNKINELRLKIDKHNKLYYDQSTQILSDFEYDQLVNELESLEKDYPEYKDIKSPTQHVGGTTTGFITASHLEPMLSLSNTYNKLELVEFDTRLRKRLSSQQYSYFIEPKIDGVAVSLLYENGVLCRALTRGNGLEGDDITNNVKTISSIPIKLKNNPPNKIEVRGEIFISKSNFNKLNQQQLESGLNLFANPRNAASGSIKLLNVDEVASRPLDAIFYGVGYSSTEFKLHSDLIQSLQSYGFITPPGYRCKTINDVFPIIDTLHKQKITFPYEIDGAVLKLDQRSYYLDLGNTSKSPRWAVAYKYSPERAETCVTDIVLQVGRTGIITPVAELEPVSLSGSVIRRATLHNADEIRRLDVRVGDRVLIEKCGEIIPKIVSVIYTKRSGSEIVFDFIKKCRQMGLEPIQENGKVAWRVSSSHPEQVKASISHFASKEAMDIDGLGYQTVSQMVDKGLIHSYVDLYELNEETLSLLDGFKHKRIHKLLNEIDLSKTKPLDRVLVALGIPNVGRTVAQCLCKEISSIDDLINMDRERLSNIPSIGPIIVDSLIQYFQDETNKEIIRSLKRMGIGYNYDPKPVVEGYLSGLSFVITGTLSTLTRDRAREMIQERGGYVQPTLKRSTDYLLVGDKPGSKLQKAIELNVPRMFESEFLNIISK